MKISKLLTLSTLSLGLSLSPVWASGAQQQKSNEELYYEVVEAVGKYIALRPYSGYKLSDKEKAALVKGFKEGLDKPMGNMEFAMQKRNIEMFLNMKAFEAEKVKHAEMMEKMAKVTMPMELKLKTSQGKETTLKELAKGQKALLIDFWATWCGACMQLMPHMNQMSEVYKKYGIKVVGINTEADPVRAESVRQDKKITFDWLVQPEDEPFTEPFFLRQLPRATLVTPEGKVLFHGHPQSEMLHLELEKLGVPHVH